MLHAEKNPQDKQKIAKLFERAKKEGIESPAVEECIALLESKGAISKARDIGRKRVVESTNNICSSISETEESKKSAELIQLLFSEMTIKM